MVVVDVMKKEDLMNLLNKEIILYEDDNVLITAKTVGIYIRTPYNADFVKHIKKIRCRGWQERTQSNVIKLVCNDAVEKALELVKEYYNADFDTEELLDRLYSEFTPINMYVFKEEDGTIVFMRPHKIESEDIYNVLRSAERKLYSTIAKYRFENASHAYNTFTKLLRLLKNHFYNWRIVISDDVLSDFRKVAQNEVSRIKQSQQLIKYSYQTAPPQPVDVPLSRGQKLYNYQRHAVWWIENVARGTGLIADEMGLGKTIEALAWLKMHQELRPVLIVCPASVKLNWANEVKKWLNEPVQVLKGRNAHVNRSASIYIINYDIVSSNLQSLKELKPAVLIIDEAHYIKNVKAKRTKAVIELAQGTPHVLALTGTPILNSAIELYPILVALKKLKWSKSAYWEFAERFTYIDTIRLSPFKVIKIPKGVRNSRELNKLLRAGIMLRRTKEQVMSQLPTKRRILIRIEVDERKYMTELKSLAKYILQVKDALEENWNNILVRIERLRQLAVALKLSDSIDFIFNTALQEHKVVVFAHHQDAIKILEEGLQKYNSKLEDGEKFKILKIVGGMSSVQKQAVVDEFNNSKRAIIIVSIRAGGEGINLQTASTAIFLELDWTPARILQAEDRLHRIGQKKQVDYYYLIAQYTIEEEMYSTIIEKLESISEVTEMKKITFKILREELVKAGVDLQKLIGKQKVKQKGGRKARKVRKTV